MNIGERVRQLRGKKSQKEFAKVCGIDDSTLSKIENGHLIGTLEIHRKICKTLGISLSTLYKGVYEDDIQPFESVPLPEEKPFAYNDKATSQFLTKNIFLNKKMLPEILTLKPQAEAEDELPADTQRFLLVLEGAIELVIRNRAFQLKQNEPFYILDASIPHLIKNTGQVQARVLRVTTPVRL